MDPISTTASIIAILQLSSKVLGYLNDIKDASKDRATCAVEAANLNSLLTALRFRLEAGDSSTPWYTAVRVLATENGPLDQFKQALEQLQEKITGRGKIGKTGNALVWKFKKEEIASILGRMERLKTLVEVALQMDHFKLSQAMKECGDVTCSNTEIIKDNTSFIRREADNAQHSKLMAWISPMDFPTQQSDFIGRRQQGTGQWFLNAPEVAQWLREPKRTLFCPGIPGAGKTMIAAIAVDHLMKTVQSSSIGVAYVYCNYKAQEEQGTDNLLAAILKQLVRTRSSLMEPVEQLYVQHVNRGTRPSVDEISAALQNVLAKFSAVHVVIDAVDECRDSDGTRHLFLAKLKDLQVKTDLRIMVTSRPFLDISDEFKTALTIDIRARDEDVKWYVAGQVHRLPRCIRCDAALQKIVEDKITEAVSGMFLLARLYTDSLLDKRTPKEVKSTLARLSKGLTPLDDAYREATQRIEGQLSGDLERAKKVLCWITYAKRPLNTTELCCALAVELKEVELDLENVPEIEDLVSVCAGLVEVDPESAIIRLVHYTAQEYFERTMEQWKPGALLETTSTCLTYLCFDAFKSGCSATDEEFEDRLQQNKFLDYAAKHWGEHAIMVESEACEQVCSFLLHRGLISCAAQVLSAPAYKYEAYTQVYHKKTTSLHLTARFGLSLISEKILACQVHEVATAVASKNSDGQTPLYLAANHGHFEMAKLLLDNGADINAQEGYFGNALTAASYQGHEQIIQLLLDNGADINAQGEHFGNALTAASYQGHEQIIQLLLDNGADINAQEGYFGNALTAASYQGHEQIIQLLLDNGADINAQGEHFGNALTAASYQGHEQIIQLLLDNGADINAQGENFGNALTAASRQGHEQIIQLLLDNGADINAQGKYFSNALTAASSQGHEQIIQLLLDNGADINAQGKYFSNALTAASSQGHEQIIQLLLDNGADINAQGEHFGNALTAASSQGHEQIIQLLLDNGADSNTQGGRFGNALTAASDRGYEQIVQLLLDNGADINAQGENFGNALTAASRQGHEQIVQLLLDNGADINAQGRGCGNALEVAGGSGHVEVVKLLLKAGSDPKSLNCDGYGSFFHLLAFKGHTNLLRLIYDQYYGTPLLPEPHGRTPLQLAARGGHFNAFQYLLSLGFDPAMTDEKGENLLHYASSGGSLEILNAVLDMNCVPHTQSERWSPIHWACRNGNPDLVERLIKEGIQSDSIIVSKPEGKWSPISIAIFHGREDMLNELSEHSMSLLDTGEDAVRLHGICYGNYYCNSCLHDIYEPRFHCRTCPNLDYCFMCRPFLSHLHENHEWDCIERPIKD